MSIRKKLITCFLVVGMIVGIGGYLCVLSSQRALRRSIGESAVSFCNEVMNKIDKVVYAKIEEFKKTD